MGRAGFFMGREFGVAKIFLSPPGDEKADLLGGGLSPVRDTMHHSGGGSDGVPGLANCPLSSQKDRHLSLDKMDYLGYVMGMG